MQGDMAFYDEIFAEIYNLIGQKKQLNEQEMNAIAFLLEKARLECERAGVSLPKIMINDRTPGTINAYMDAEIRKIENRLEANRKKTKMYSLAHSILADSHLNETYETGNGFKNKN